MLITTNKLVTQGDAREEQAWPASSPNLVTVAGAPGDDRKDAERVLADG
jgi:hypothetical protein